MGQVRMVGYNPEGRMVYDALMDTGAYYDGDHRWDNGAEIGRLRLSRVIGQISEDDGDIYEQWETHFDPETGDFVRSIVYHRDETRVHHAGDADYADTVVPVQTSDMNTTQQVLPL